MTPFPPPLYFPKNICESFAFPPFRRCRLSRFTEDQLKKLKTAYASGVLRVRYGDTDITYQSMAEMRKAISVLEKELGVNKQKIRLSTVQYDNGL